MKIVQLNQISEIIQKKIVLHAMNNIFAVIIIFKTYLGKNFVRYSN